jgi:hypothetical protein
MSEQLLLDKYETACKAIRECLPKDNGGAVAELRFGEAYQNLVKAGLARQIRKKYRSHNG